MIIADPASRYDEVLDRSRHVGQDLLRRIDREDRWRDVGNKLEQAVKKATPRVTSARNSFYNPLKLFDDNIDHYTELQERLHAELKVVYGFEFLEEDKVKLIASFPLFAELDESMKLVHRLRTWAHWDR